MKFTDRNRDMPDDKSLTDKEWNEQFDFARIKDEYFRLKLEQGMVRYNPEDWTVFTDMEENELA